MRYLTLFLKTSKKTSCYALKNLNAKTIVFSNEKPRCDKEKSFNELRTTGEEAGMKIMLHINHYIEST